MREVCGVEEAEKGFQRTGIPIGDFQWRTMRFSYSYPFEEGFGL